MTDNGQYGRAWLQVTLRILCVVVGLLLAILTLKVFGPVRETVVSAPASRRASDFVKLQATSEWATVPVYDGRIKPFETAATESVRQITGRAAFEGCDATAIVVSWMFGERQLWEEHPFILCDHQQLRNRIFADDYSRSSLQKYVSPRSLRESTGFGELLAEVGRLRDELHGKAHLRMTVEHLKAEEVGRRLMHYDAICGQRFTLLRDMALQGDRLIKLDEFADARDVSRDEAIRLLHQSIRKVPDPFRMVALDRAPGSGWFSLPQLQIFVESPDAWREMLVERSADRPDQYQVHGQELAHFQDQLEANRVDEATGEVAQILAQRRQELLQRFDRAYASGDRDETNALLKTLLPDEDSQSRFLRERTQLASQGLDAAGLHAKSIVILDQVLSEMDGRRLNRLQREAVEAISQGYDRKSPKFRHVHLMFLDLAFPDLYESAGQSQPLPLADANVVLRTAAELQLTYKSDDASDRADANRELIQQIENASNHQRILGIASRVRDDQIEAISNQVELAWQLGVSREIARTQAKFMQLPMVGPDAAHPGSTPARMLAWEYAFNHVKPFFWSWLIMLAALTMFVFGLGVRSIAWYAAALCVYSASLVVQLVGFVMRTMIAGRAPVANMYETVIFVAFMSAIFALVLELVYRRRVIALAGALVSALGLILADLIPVALDPKISPMVPVLRTNFWLTVHVLTIVSSYAGGTLAWGLGNLTLGFMAFGKGTDVTLRTLSLFTYRAMQIAVLLLAAGTFLGGCWAAESWGRFWGWDPKEVGALVALVCYVIPLHARYIGWVRDFGLAVSAVLCYASIIVSWYVINFILAAGLHSYGFSAGGGKGVLWACLLNIEWVLIATLLYLRRSMPREAASDHSPLLAT